MQKLKVLKNDRGVEYIKVYGTEYELEFDGSRLLEVKKVKGGKK